jgi:hypothetical protein
MKTKEKIREKMRQQNHQRALMPWISRNRVLGYSIMSPLLAKASDRNNSVMS